MKNVIIVLLIAAIGGGAYYFFTQKNQDQKPVALTSQDLILGKWKLDSLQFEFNKDSAVFIINGKTTDTARYNFENEKSLTIQSKRDPTKEVWNIIKLDSLNLAVLDKDSDTLTFQKQMP